MVSALLLVGGCAPGGVGQNAIPADEPGVRVAFERLTTGPAVTDRASSGGISLIVYDGDGDTDLYVSNGYDVSAETPEPQLNRLYRNDGGSLVPVTEGPLVEDAGYPSGSTWADIDNDGDQNMVVANWGSAPAMYLNDATCRFTSVAVDRLDAPIAAASSVASADIDGDGLLDIFIGNWANAPGPEEENLVLMNRSTGGNWLEVQLTGTESNASGIGARVEISSAASGAKQVREVQAHTGWRSQNDLVQHFGLGSEDVVDITVRWPSGGENRRTGVAANQTIRITESPVSRHPP